MRVLVMKGQSQYGGTRLFADEAAAAVRRRGGEAVVLDLASDAPHGPALEAAAGEGAFDLVLSFNILGEFRDSGGRTMAELFGCPHVVWHTDYVLSSWPRLQGTPADTALLVVDPTQINAVVATAGAGRFTNLRFFSHPAVGEPAPDEPDVDAFMAARPIEVLWAGGFVKPQRPWAMADAGTRKVFDDAVELALSVEWMAPHEAFAASLRAAGINLDDPAQRATLVSAAVVDAEVRERRRHAFLVALSKSGVALHICGAGWEPHLYRFKGATYHGAVEMTRTAELMRQSRVVLNTNGNFGAGSHERPFSASLAGAAVFSDTSRYYEAAFRPGEAIELFSWLDLPGAMAKLRALAGDPERCWRQARVAKALTLERHTWDRQLDQVFDAAGVR